jgi:cytochrome c biogenesis protein ResB
MDEKRVYPATWNALQRAWRFVARMDVAAVLIVIVLLAAALGSCFPYLSPATTADAERLAHWETSIRAQYGMLADLLLALEALRWFRSPVFLVPLALLTAATLICLLDRSRQLWCMLRDGNRWGALATLANHFAVLLLLLGVALSSAYGWREELTIAPGATIEVGRGSGLGLHNERFTIARYPDGSVAQYDAQIAIIKNSKEVTRGNLQVNQPLFYDDVGFYLQGYREIEHGYSVALLAAHDPGYALVIAAGLLFLAGVVLKVIEAW